jgi:predicted ATPase
MAVLKSIRIRGFKSIRELNLELRPLNVLIGANGAGKSNLLSFFEMLGDIRTGSFRNYVAASGRAHSLLHFGPKQTNEIEAALLFETEQGSIDYRFRLLPGAADSMYFGAEGVEVVSGKSGHATTLRLGTGHPESLLLDASQRHAEAREVYQLLSGCRMYHFHDTSATARARHYSTVTNDSSLLPYAGNLPAMLYRFRERERGPAYRRIVATIRQLLPQFGDFVLEPTGSNRDEVILNWRESGSDIVFGPHQLSDGSLRAISLTTLLLQPADLLPHLVVIDEPELGLHPAAKNILAGLLKSASQRCQLIVATQSPELVDAFEPEDVVVVEREERQSVFRRLSTAALEDWLKEYTLGQLWEKNVFGGGPFA